MGSRAFFGFPTTGTEILTNNGMRWLLWRIPKTWCCAAGKATSRNRRNGQVTCRKYLQIFFRSMATTVHWRLQRWLSPSVQWLSHSGRIKRDASSVFTPLKHLSPSLSCLSSQSIIDFKTSRRNFSCSLRNFECGQLLLQMYIPSWRQDFRFAFLEAPQVF